MLTILVSDIFGLSDALEELADQLPGTTKIIDPYAGAKLRFDNESAAYEYFVAHVGMHNYEIRLAEALNKCNEAMQLLGFSVGATACWKLACSATQKNIRQALCFYGSRIRHHVDLDPRIKTTIVLPKMEPTFDVLRLANSVCQKKRVQVLQTNYLHGFMNPQSDNFDVAAYAEFTYWLNNELAVQ